MAQPMEVADEMLAPLVGRFTELAYGRRRRD